MNTSWLSAGVLLLYHKSYYTRSFRKSLGIITAFTCDVPRNRPAGHNVCKTANCQQDFTLLLKSEVCNYFNFIPLLFSSKRHFFGNRKIKTYTISHTLAFQSMFQENHLLFLISSLTIWLQTLQGYSFWKLCPWEFSFHLKEIDKYFQNGGTGLKRTIKMPLSIFYGNRCITYLYSIK